MVIYAILIDISFNINYYINKIEAIPGSSFSYANFWFSAEGIEFGFILPFISGGLGIISAYKIRKKETIDS